MIRWTCQSCAKVLRAKDADAGKKTRCPNCKAVASIPVPIAAPAPAQNAEWVELVKQMPEPEPSLQADVVPAGSGRDEPEMQTDEADPGKEAPKASPPTPAPNGAARGNRARLLGWAVIGFIFLALCCAAIGVFFLVQKDNQAAAAKQLRERDRLRNIDYFRGLKLSYHQSALRQFASVWFRSHPRNWPNVDYSTREGLVSKMAGDSADGIDASLAANRRAFVDQHGIDMKDWKSRFREQFPETDVIYDEIDVSVRQIAQERSIEALRNVGGSRAEAIDAYFRQQAPKIVNEVREHVDSLPSIKALKAKVNAK
jgi:phage FluMu protein Com